MTDKDEQNQLKSEEIKKTINSKKQKRSFSTEEWSMIETQRL